MSVGFGIFLGALLIALVMLYRFTQDRWNWSRLMGRAGIGIACLIALIVAGIGIYALYNAIASRPKPQSAYADLKIGMTMAEVLYIKGFPGNVEVGPGEASYTASTPPDGSLLVMPVKDFKGDQRVQQYRHWSYDNPNGSRLDIEFDSNQRRLKEITCYSQSFMDCSALLGITDGTTEDELISKLGTATGQSFNSGVKKATYTPLHARFFLSKRQVYMMTVFE